MHTSVSKSINAKRLQKMTECARDHHDNKKAEADRVSCPSSHRSGFCLRRDAASSSESEWASESTMSWRKSSSYSMMAREVSWDIITWATTVLLVWGNQWTCTASCNVIHWLESKHSCNGLEVQWLGTVNKGWSINMSGMLGVSIRGSIYGVL